MSDIEDAAPRGEALTLEQRAELRSFLQLSLKNGLLNIVTLTLYRFWGKTEVRRRVWSSTWLNGEPLEYTGRGIELFLGFLFALVVLGLPFLIMVFAAQFMGPVGSLLIFPLELLLFFMVGVGVFTALRYMASRTVWRGLRFQLTGSPFRFAFALLGLGFLSGVTFGWFWPQAQRMLAGRLWEGLAFGDRRFRFDQAAAGKVKVYPAYAIGWCASVIGYILFMGLIFAAAAAQRGQAGPPSPASLVPVIYIGALVLGLVLTVAFSAYRAAALRSVAAGVRFGEARFSLALRWPEMAWLTLSNFALLVVSLGFLMPFMQARTAKFMISRIRAEGAVDLASIHQAERGPKTGEGLADAFGLAPI